MQLENTNFIKFEQIPPLMEADGDVFLWGEKSTKFIDQHCDCVCVDHLLSMQ